MAKCAIFVTTQQQEESARAVLRERGEDMPIYMTHPLRVPTEAMELVRREGIQVIIARGGVALEFRKCTDLPIIDLVLTVQELGMLIVEAKAMLGCGHPTIALITYKNMLGDMSDVETLFGVKLKIYYVTTLDEMAPATRRAAEEGAQLAIGGIYVQAACQDLGLPYLSNPAGKASVRHALQIASRVSYSIDLQERSSAERNTLLNFSFNGIIRLDRSGAIVAMNRRAESLLELSEAEARGRSICACIPAIDPQRLENEVFQSGEELFCTFWSGEDALAVSIAPIGSGDAVEGAIASCYDIERMSRFEREARSDLSGCADSSQYSYQWLSTMAEEHTPFLKALSEQAQFDTCALICSPGTPERSGCAGFIRANGLRRNMPYCQLSAASYTPEEQEDILFGTPEHPGAMESANGGTLFLDEVEALSPQCQQRLCRLITEGQLITRGGCRTVDIKVLAGTGLDLTALCEAGQFRRDLFYALSAHTLVVPPLTGRPNAIAKWSAFYLEHYSALYGRCALMTKAARRALGACPWPGGHAQLQCFCRRAAAESPRRALDEAAVNRLLQASGHTDTSVIVQSGGTDRELLTRLIEKYGGNRAQIAEELQISKTTLWRRMKQCGLL